MLFKKFLNLQAKNKDLRYNTFIVLTIFAPRIKLTCNIA